MKKHRIINPVFGFLAILLTHLPAFAAEEADNSEKDTLEQIEITFKDAQGKLRNLDEFQGKVIVLNLWATWCAPCVKEMPALNKLAQKYSQQGLAVVALSQDNSPNKVKEFYAKLNIGNLDVFMDSNMQTLRKLKGRGLPITIVLGTDGNEIQRFEGYYDWESPQARKLIADHLPKR